VIRVWRGAALALAARPDGISLYHVFRLGNARNRRLPRITERHALTQCLCAILQYSSQALGCSREPPVSHAFRPKHAVEQMPLGLRQALKRFPSRRESGHAS
jgi:hypothetical protein